MTEQTSQNQGKSLLLGWPEIATLGKVIQLKTDKGLVLLIIPGTNRRHFSSLDILLRELKIERVENIPKSKEEGHFFPEPKGPRYEVTGMGLATFDHNNKYAYFYGDSTDYGLGINAAHLEKVMMDNKPDWDYRVGN